MTFNPIPLHRKIIAAETSMLLAGILASSILFSPAVAQTAAPTQPPQASALAGPSTKPATSSTPYRNQPPRVANREAAIYEAVWGIADPTVKAVESGVILRFSYRVLDPAKAKPLNDKKLNPVLESPEKGIREVIPSMEKVGQLRQAPEKIEAGQSYWMAFSNSGRLLKPGDRVDIVIGNFHARGILVE
jgi:hypothetical protein